MTINFSQNLHLEKW